MSKRVLVTGGSGKVGKWGITDLQAHNFFVINADRRRADRNQLLSFSECIIQTSPVIRRGSRPSLRRLIAVPENNSLDFNQNFNCKQSITSNRIRFDSRWHAVD